MASPTRSTAWRTLLALALGLLLTAVVGLVLNRVWQALACVLALYCGISMFRMLRVEHWLRTRRVSQPPDYEGTWGEIIAIVNRIYRRKQFHKRRVVQLLREFRRLTSAMPDGAVLLNAENEILWFNQRAAEWLKLQRKRDFGFRIENLLRHPNFIDYMRKISKDGAADGAVFIPMPGEITRWISVYLVQTRNAPQRLLIVRDVTRQMLLESMRKDFVANASHELRSPLTVITGYLDALGDDESLAAGWREPIGEMRRQSYRMRAIIDDLLELSRLEESHELAADDPVNIGGILAMLRKEVLSLERRPKTITLQIDSPKNVRGAENELHSVFSNLINNAVKYTPVEGEIQIRWWVDAEGGHVSVLDTGIGIASEHIPRLTERFYRVDAGRSRALGGSGLGLAIVKHALQRHEAQLEVRSELGRGSTFICHFPLQRITAAAQMAEMGLQIGHS